MADRRLRRYGPSPLQDAVDTISFIAAIVLLSLGLVYQPFLEAFLLELMGRLP